ncbi:transposase, partial [Saccharospirillum salsuginis]
QCLSEKGTFREIYRWEHEEVLDRHRQRMEADQEDRMRQRSALAEHPFGTLKCRSGWTHFLVRSFKKVRGEWNLMALCYNFSRVISILGMDGLMEHLDPKAALQGR